MTEDPEDRGYRPTRLWGPWQVQSFSIIRATGAGPLDRRGCRGKTGQCSSIATSRKQGRLVRVQGSNQVTKHAAKRRNGPKGRQKAPKSAQCAPTPRNQARAVSWATWLKIRFRGHLVHPQPPFFCGFQASKSPNETPRPRYQWSFGAAGGQRGPHTVGANRGSTMVPGAEKIIFSKVVPRPLGMLKRVFLARFEPVVTRFGPWKFPT